MAKKRQKPKKRKKSRHPKSPFPPGRPPQMPSLEDAARLLGMPELAAIEGLEEVWEAMRQPRKPPEVKATESPELEPALIALVEGPVGQPSYGIAAAGLTPESLRLEDEEEMERCGEETGRLIECFSKYLRSEHNLPEELASQYASAVDHYARDFLLPYGGYTVLGYEEGFIRTFLGNWYIRKHMAPELDWIYVSLRALAAFYAFLYRVGWIDRDRAEQAIQECRDHAWYKKRLEGYWKVSDKAFADWAEEYNYDFF